ncbi:MAG: hypothetical protein H8E66_18970 [Planctomycetes bacterium]|nr:hypothetical protein [Planctomycetota bacterium]
MEDANKVSGATALYALTVLTLIIVENPRIRNNANRAAKFDMFPGLASRSA